MTRLNDGELRRAIAYNRRRHDDAAEVLQAMALPGTGWNPATVAAVAEWQHSYGLQPDGMVGPRTLEMVREVVEVGPSGGVIVGDRRVDLGFPCTTWRDSRDVQSLRARARRGEPSEIVVHESVTRNMSTTQRVLAKRGLGVHLMIERDGRITQHCDLVDDVCWHMPHHNHASVGVEVVNPYKPRYDRTGADVIENAPWAHGDSYVLPSLAQVRSLSAIVDGVCAALAIPHTFRGVVGKKYYLHQIPLEDEDERYADPAPGVWSHQQIGAHADGSWPLLVLALQHYRGIAVGDAYEEAVDLATGARRYVEI